MLHISVADSRVRSLFVCFCYCEQVLGSKCVLWLLFVNTVIIQVNTDSFWKLVVILRWNYPRSTLVFSHKHSESFSESIIDSFKHWLVALTRKHILTNSEWDHQHYQVCRHSVVCDRTLLILSYVFVLNQVTRCSLYFSMARLSG